MEWRGGGAGPSASSFARCTQIKQPQKKKKKIYPFLQLKNENKKEHLSSFSQQAQKKRPHILAGSSTRTVVQYSIGLTVTYPAPRTGDGVLTDRVRLRHDLHARELVVLEDVAVHLAGYAVLVVAHLVPAKANAGTLAAHDLVVPDDRRARAAVDACTDKTRNTRRQNETRYRKKINKK